MLFSDELAMLLNAKLQVDPTSETLDRLVEFCERNYGDKKPISIKRSLMKAYTGMFCFGKTIELGNELLKTYLATKGLNNADNQLSEVYK